MSKGGIDYSKWDKLDVSDSEDDDDDDDGEQDAAPFAQPRVTRLEGPSKVTFGNSGDLLVEASSVSEKLTATETKSFSSQQAATAPTASTKETPTEPTCVPELWTRNGSVVDSTPNSSSSRPLYWSQDRYSVTMRLELPSDAKAKDMSVELQGVLPYRDRNAAVGSDQQKASISVKCQSIQVLFGEFPHPVHAVEDDEFDNKGGTAFAGNWSIERLHNDKPYLCLSINKATPMANMTIWWRQPLKGFPEISIEQANPSYDNSNNANARNQSQAFQQAWDEAHKQFQQNIKDKKQQTLP